jgi:hypothetical protein
LTGRPTRLAAFSFSFIFGMSVVAVIVIGSR